MSTEVEEWIPNHYYQGIPMDLYFLKFLNFHEAHWVSQSSLLIFVFSFSPDYCQEVGLFWYFQRIIFFLSFFFINLYFLCLISPSHYFILLNLAFWFCFLPSWLSPYFFLSNKYILREGEFPGEASA